jgi:hypothetical protein
MQPLALDEVMKASVQHDRVTHLLEAHCKNHLRPFP